MQDPHFSPGGLFQLYKPQTSIVTQLGWPLGAANMAVLGFAATTTKHGEIIIFLTPFLITQYSVVVAPQYWQHLCVLGWVATFLKGIASQQ